MTMRIGVAIRKARIFSGLSQDGLAYLIGSPRTYISKIELEYCTPRLEQIERIASALGMKVSALIYDAEGSSPIEVPQSSLSSKLPVQ